MKNMSRVFKKIIVGSIVITILLPTVLITSKELRFNEEISVNSSGNVSEDDRKAAEEISNMTGYKVDEILNMKSHGENWNEILEKLKKAKPSISEDIDKKLLTGEAVDSEFINKLKSEGFNDNDISEVKMLVDRVMFQLSEITSNLTNSDEDLTKDDLIKSIDSSDVKEEEKIYKDIASKFEAKKAILLALKLRDAFGGQEKVLDEYLISIQIEIDLEKYLSDMKAYEKDKEEKVANKDVFGMINLSKIEAKMLELIQKSNSKSNKKTSDLLGEDEKNISDVVAGIQNDDILPKVQLPKVNVPKAENPANDVMKEIESINEKTLK